MNTEAGGDIGIFWIVTETMDGPPIGFGAAETRVTIFGGDAAEARAREYLNTAKES